MDTLDIIFWFVLLIFLVYEAINVMKRIKEPATKKSAYIEIVLIIVVAAALIQGVQRYNEVIEEADGQPDTVIRRITNVARSPFKKKAKPAPKMEMKAPEEAPAAVPAKPAKKK